MLKVENVRKWLERNKIFFETLGVILLSIMAVIVSYEAFLISSYQANQVEMENQPEFLFSMETVPYKAFISSFNESGNWSNDYFVIKNEGKPFKKLKIEYSIITGLGYSSFDRKQNNTVQKDLEIPLVHYVSESPQIDPDGYIRIRQIFPKSYTDSIKYDRVLNAFQSFIKPTVDVLYFMDLSRYLKIQYTDIYDKSHTNYYIINSEGGSIQISKEDYEKLLSRVNVSDVPVKISDYGLLYIVHPGNVQSEFFNQTILEPWHHSFKTKFDET